MMSSFLHRRARALLTVALVAAGFACPLHAQYFGQNKVHYRDMNFSVLKTEHFDIYFYARERAGIDMAARMAERWYARLSALLEHELRGRQPLIIYASAVDFQQTNVIPGDLGEGTGGVTEPLRRRIVLPIAASLSDTDHVIGHELVHAFQFDMTSSSSQYGPTNGAERLPLWFIEGMAEYLSLGPVDPNTTMWLRDAVRQNDLPSIKDLDNPKYFPYRWGQAFWAYVGGRFGDRAVRQMLLVGGASGDTDTAIQRVLGMSKKELSQAWQNAIRDSAEQVFASTVPPREEGHLVVAGSQNAGELYVGPALSPDGSKVALLSSRNLLSIDLYVLDTATGRTLRKLTSTATDAHFSSIQFIDSAGGWDHAGRRIAIAAVADGRPSLAIFDVDSGDKTKEVSLPDLDQIANPTWAPDDHAICFAALSHGVTDLYVYDLTASRLVRLTNDAFTDLQPSWSPDGRRIVFATDRFSTNLDALAPGPYRLGIIDAVGGRVDEVRTFGEGDSINPQWNADATAIYFISNRTGIPNVYRVPASGGGAVQLTNVGTGVSGITASSPALSVASQSGVAGFSVYEKSGYAIYTIDPDRRGTPPEAPIAAAAVLPPVNRGSSAVVAALANKTRGLPADQTFPTQPYRATLSLEGLGQPTLGVGVDRFGPAVGGGISAYFSDMLANHMLATALSVNSAIGGNLSWKDIGAQAAYVSQANRWQWGVLGGQVPYLSAGFGAAVGTTTAGEPVEIDQTTVFRQTERTATLFTAYPFSRARRFELQAGATQISFDQTTETSVSSLITGQLLSDNVQSSRVADPVTLATASAAMVWDTTSFGATSPVAGQRYRLEVAPAFGTINFTNVLADYRRYFMPLPFFTFAGRILHDGRYGNGAEDARLFPMYLGYPGLVRGYDVTTFDASDCVATATSDCPVLDRLVGSRMLIGNFEFRFPLLRPFTGVSQNMYGPLPIELAVFGDAGFAWNRGERPSILGGDRKGVSSAGVALRVNVFGMLVTQFDFVRPFQRPGRGWVFEFNLGPGF
jgi:hypothetical protein